MITNKQYYDFLRESIKENPSFTNEARAKEIDALNLVFEDVENGIYRSKADIGTIIIDEPHTTNAFISVLYDRIVRDGTRENLKSVNKLEIFQTQDLSNGVGFSVTVVDKYDVEDYDNNLSPIGNFDSRVGEAISMPPLKKRVEFTFSQSQLQTAFLNDSGISGLLASMINKVKETLNIYVYGTLKDEIIKADTTTDLNVNFITEEIDVTSDTSLTGLRQVILRTAGNIFENGVVTQVLTNNADDLENPLSETPLKDVQLAGLKELIARINDDVLKMSEPSTSYNYGDTDGGFTSNLPLGEGVLVINAKVLSALNVTADSLFNSNSDYGKYFKQVIPIYVDGTTGKDDKLVFGYSILHPQAIEYKYLLNKQLEWTNPRSLYTNFFTHMWYSILCNPFVSSLCKFFRTAD